MESPPLNLNTNTDPIPTVSVLMSVYNSERYVKQTIESILAQTLTDFELIIIDDGSTDGSLQILQTYAAQDQRIRLKSRENQGIPKTRNELLQMARSEWVAVIDSDDIALPQRLELQVNFLRQNPQIVCVGGSFDVIDHQGRYLVRLHLPTEDPEIQASALAGHGSICHPAAMMRREVVLAVGGYDERYLVAQDLDLWLKLGEVGMLANLPDPVLQYRIHHQSISGQDPMAQRRFAKEACEEAWRRRGIQGTFEATEPWRPIGTKESQHAFSLKYGWWAFNSQQFPTAMIYGFKAIQALPLVSEGWKLLILSFLRSVSARSLLRNP